MSIKKTSLCLILFNKIYPKITANILQTDILNQKLDKYIPDLTFSLHLMSILTTKISPIELQTFVHINYQRPFGPVLESNPFPGGHGIYISCRGFSGFHDYDFTFLTDLW